MDFSGPENEVKDNGKKRNVGADKGDGHDPEREGFEQHILYGL
jgi:hypothetical protein